MVSFKISIKFHSYKPCYNSLFLKTNIISPILKPKAKIENQDFYRAYHAHLNFLEITSDIPYEKYDQLFDDILDGYQKSSDDTLVSLINFASFIIYIYSQLNIINQAQIFSQIKNRKLKHYSKINDSLENKIEEELKEDLEDIQENIFDIFVELKKKHFCTDLVDYLIALMYCNQLITNDLDETNSIIGTEMMKTLALLKNRYAIRYFKIIVDLFEE